MQDSPARWVAIHRRHHHYTDEVRDPHSPLVTFLWAHVGWVMTKSDDLMRTELFERYGKDLMRDPLYRFIEATYAWGWIVALSWLAFFLGGYAAASLQGATQADAVQFGLSLLVWGCLARTVVVWHITWSINSITHLWGYRNYDTPDGSRNNVLIGLISNGEGWHNNHHADPASARHGHRWWEFDVAWLTIRLLMRAGLARNVALPSAALRQRGGEERGP